MSQNHQIQDFCNQTLSPRGPAAPSNRPLSDNPEDLLDMDIIETFVPGADPIALRSYYPYFVNSGYYANCELQTKRWCVKNIKADWHVFDAGANIGYYSVLFARLAKQGYVIAFEPTSTKMMLDINLAFNQIDNVQVRKVALGASSGNKLEAVYRIWGKKLEKANYTFSTIDKEMRRARWKKLDLIKIDVDGFDFEVLNGAENTLHLHNPHVIIEINSALETRGIYLNRVFSWLTSRGYSKCTILDESNFLIYPKGNRTHSGEISVTVDSEPVYIPDKLSADIVKGEKSFAYDTKIKSITLQEMAHKWYGNKITTQGALDIVDSHLVPQALGFKSSAQLSGCSIGRPISSFTIASEDPYGLPVLQALYRLIAPKRHLEFGTYFGGGVILCAQSCNAHIWTINLPSAEVDENGRRLYHHDDKQNIGYLYKNEGLSDRVTQLFMDSRDFKPSDFSPDFFDSVFVDGGHTPDVVKSDTENGLKVLRSGGIMIWHDFCPDPNIIIKLRARQGVVSALLENWPKWHTQFSQLFWIRPTLLLVGIKK